jgi:hypothetical protein
MHHLFRAPSAPPAYTLHAIPPTNDKERVDADTHKTPTYFDVFTVEEFESNGKTGKRWTKIGAAFPHKEGLGFSIELKAFPIDGRLVVLPPDPDDNRSNE